MLVLCVLYSKDKRHNQDKEVVQMKCREQNKKKNPGGGMDVCLLWVLCELSGRGLCDEPISRPVLPTVACLNECDYENLNLRKPRPMRAVEL
jgi:hypothetical protein